MVAALAIALVALGVAIGAWFRPTTTASAPPAEPQYSEQEVADAKKALCDAYAISEKAVGVAGGQTSEDPGENYAIKVNTRLAASASAAYLLSHIQSDSMAPKDLLDHTRDLADLYQQTVLMQVAVAPTDKLEALYSKIESTSSDIRETCQ